MSDKPNWVTILEAEPCQCVRCNYCGGSGTIYLDIGGRVVRSMVDDTDSPEPCEECRGGICEECDRCTMLNDYDMEEVL